MKKLYYILLTLMITMFSISNVEASNSMVLCEYSNSTVLRGSGAEGSSFEMDVDYGVTINYNSESSTYELFIDGTRREVAGSIEDLFDSNNVYSHPSGINNTEFVCPSEAYVDVTGTTNEVCFSNNGIDNCDGNIGTTFSGESTMVDNYRDAEYANLEVELNQNIQTEKEEIINAILNGESVDVETAIEELLSVYDGYPPELINITRIQNDILSEIESALSEGESQIENNENLTEAQREELLNNYNEVSDSYNEASINITGTGARAAINDCKALLGSVDNPDDTAYWFKLALDVLKYLGIVALIVLTIVDFIGAVAAQDNDAISKATKKTVTRLVFAVLLFIVPTILQFIFDLAGITTTVDCGVNSAKS